MPSLVIHLAIAKRYTELHPDKISNLSDFRKGSIAPDLSKDFSRMLSKPEKKTTHYHFKPEENAVDFEMFKRDERVNLLDDYWKGYYAHLLADHLFYTSVFKQEVEQAARNNADLYNDFTIMTSQIIEDFHPKLDIAYVTDAVKQCLAIKHEECKYLDYAKVHDFIEKMVSVIDQAI